MPKVKTYKNKQELFVQTAFGKNIATYQVTDEGVRVLEGFGAGNGGDITPFQLHSMKIQGLIYTGNGGFGTIENERIVQTEPSDKHLPKNFYLDEHASVPFEHNYDGEWLPLNPPAKRARYNLELTEYVYTLSLSEFVGRTKSKRPDADSKLENPQVDIVVDDFGKDQSFAKVQDGCDSKRPDADPQVDIVVDDFGKDQSFAKVQDSSNRDDKVEIVLIPVEKVRSRSKDNMPLKHGKHKQAQLLDFEINNLLEWDKINSRLKKAKHVRACRQADNLNKQKRKKLGFFRLHASTNFTHGFAIFVAFLTLAAILFVLSIVIIEGVGRQ